MAEGLITPRDSFRNWWRSVRFPFMRPRRSQLAPAKRREGKYLSFLLLGASFGYPVWQIRSRRGDFAMGRIEWNPSWEAYSFVPLEEIAIVRWNAGAVAEVYAFLKERGTETGRFL